MAAQLADNGYGKSAVRLVKVARAGSRHILHDLTVDMRCEGAFEAAHVVGDNAFVLPTDTMKNTVYALARRHEVHPPEAFAARIGAHLLSASPHVARVFVDVARHSWERITSDGRSHDTAFEHGGDEARTTHVMSARGGAVVVEAGIRDLVVLRTAGSAFSGFPRDAWTTLKETRDRIFATAVTARWRYGAAMGDYNVMFAAVRQALLNAFANHRSESVQHTLYAMGEAALESNDALEDIHLSLPNRHHLLVDLAPLGLDNPNEIFVATTEPYGLIEATVRRSA